jgi:ELWxxDGT repeat protein
MVASSALPELMSFHSCAQTLANGLRFFAEYTTQNGYQLWQGDGTATGTVIDTSLNTGGSNVPTDFVVMGTTLFFTAPGASLWSLPT